MVNTQEGAMRRVVQTSLKLAGFDEKQIIWNDPRFDTEFERVLVLGTVTRHATMKAPEATEFLRQLGNRIPEGAERRIYLSRNGYSRRRLVNEAEIWPLFEQQGFVRVSAEEIPFEEQIALFKGVEFVAGNLGAAFSNLAFAPDGVKTLALTTEAMEHDFFYDIICHKHGSYFAVQGTADSGEATMASDFTVDPETVAASLDELLE